MTWPRSMNVFGSLRAHFENVELDMLPEEKALYEFVFLEAQDTIKDAFKMQRV